MKKIFVDTENVQNYDCLKSLKLTKRDEVILFFSQNTKTLKVDYLNLICSFGCKIKSILLEVKGNNSLDFHIITNLCLNYSTKNEYYILSNDRGYESSIDQFNLQGHSNVRILNWYKLDQDELEIKRIYKLSKNKSDFHDKLCKKFGKEGQKIYQQFKTMF